MVRICILESDEVSDCLCNLDEVHTCYCDFVHNQMPRLACRYADLAARAFDCNMNLRDRILELVFDICICDKYLFIDLRAQYRGGRRDDMILVCPFKFFAHPPTTRVKDGSCLQIIFSTGDRSYRLCHL